MAIQFAEDPNDLYSAAVTLAPVLLLTTVLVTRRSVSAMRGRQKWAASVLVVGPAYPAMVFSVAGLASENSPTWITVTVLFSLFAQIGLSLASFWQALHDVSLPPS